MGAPLMSNVLIVPERNEGTSPLLVVEEGLKSERIDAACVVDGWSTDDTVELLGEALPGLAEKYGKDVTLLRSKLRNTGKGGAMVAGLEFALGEGHARIVFADADISSVTPGWFDHLVDGIDLHEADMTRGYFDRSRSDAQITRHITVPAINMFFPEGHGIHQPLGGELCMKDSLARFLLEYELAPPHTWGIDTFITIASLMGGFRIVELYLVQKLHSAKRLDDLEDMLKECFDEVARLVHAHERHRHIPRVKHPRVITRPRSESTIERVGTDVRQLTYEDPEADVEALFRYVGERRPNLGILADLGVSQEDVALLSRLLRDPGAFYAESHFLDAETWIRMLNAVLRGYISSRFPPHYRDAIFTLWRLRALTFLLHEADGFEEAEESTKRQAELAFALCEAAMGSPASD